MAKTKNNLSAAIQKIFYTRNDSHVFVPQNSTHNKTCNPNDPPWANRETSSFIVDWQLPGMAMRDIDKSYS